MDETVEPEDAPSEAAPAAPGPDPAPTPAPSVERSWAHRHPWGLAIVTGLMVAVIVGGYSWLREQSEPIAIGRSGSIGSFTYTLREFDCKDSAPADRPYESESTSESPDMQVCEAHLSVRNNGNAAGGPFHDMTLYVGDNRFDTDDSLITADIFPDQTATAVVSFDIPLGVDPTKLRIVPRSESYADLLIPFYNEWVTYDLG